LNGMLIGISGYAGTGKDTLFSLLKEVGEENGERFARAAFADQVKQDLRCVVLERMGINPFTKDPDLKKIIRPIMVAYAEAQRSIDDMYWVNQIQNKVDFLLTNGVNVCITDTRYVNEAGWIQGKGLVVYLNRSIITPPNDSERKNISLVKKSADLIIDWPEMNNKQLRAKAESTYKEIKNAYYKKFGVGPQYENNV
jgi:hypothetical protein